MQENSEQVKRNEEESRKNIPGPALWPHRPKWWCLVGSLRPAHLGGLCRAPLATRPSRPRFCPASAWAEIATPRGQPALAETRFPRSMRSQPRLAGVTSPSAPWWAEVSSCPGGLARLAALGHALPCVPGQAGIPGAGCCSPRLRLWLVFSSARGSTSVQAGARQPRWTGAWLLFTGPGRGTSVLDRSEASHCCAAGSFVWFFRLVDAASAGTTFTEVLYLGIYRYTSRRFISPTSPRLRGRSRPNLLQPRLRYPGYRGTFCLRHHPVLGRPLARTGVYRQLTQHYKTRTMTASRCGYSVLT